MITIFSYPSITVLLYNDKSYYNISKELVWYYNDAGYGHNIHGFLLFFAATFTLLCLLPYTMLVTFSFFLCNFVWSASSSLLYMLTVDHSRASGGFGLHLWVTIILFSVNGALKGTNTNRMFLSHIVIVLILIVLQAFLHPFKKTSV